MSIRINGWRTILLIKRFGLTWVMVIVRIC